MASTLSGSAIRCASAALLTLFSSVTTGIHVHRGQIEVIRAADKGNVSVVFLPTHRSHFDYGVLSFVLHCYDIRAPYIVSGGANIFEIIMKCNSLPLQPDSTLGAFFIKRRLANESGEKDLLYKAVLQEYVSAILQNKEHLEIFDAKIISRESGNTLKSIKKPKILGPKVTTL
eukprot:m.164716 g.164716  ORF g.164716 m.164716 type:complete len:173 (+) comp38886_c2_seq3:288-806(+)